MYWFAGNFDTCKQTYTLNTFECGVDSVTSSPDFFKIHFVVDYAAKYTTNTHTLNSFL